MQDLLIDFNPDGLVDDCVSDVVINLAPAPNFGLDIYPTEPIRRA